MTNPKQLFEELAQSTWTRLGLSWDYNISQGEETITDLLQLEIARFGSPHVRVLKTTKALAGHRARTRADSASRPLRWPDASVRRMRS